MSELGTFRVDRDVFEHPVFAREPFTEREAWLWLISEAAFKPHQKRVVNAAVALERGQVCHSFRFLGRKWKWSLGRVQRFITKLKIEKMVLILSDTPTIQLTICNYNAYQGAPQKADTAPIHQRVKEEVKERKEEKKKKPSASCATALPTTWKLDEPCREYARSKGMPEARIESEAERFLNNALANGRTYKNWYRAWCNWVTSPYQQQSLPLNGVNGNGQYRQGNGQGSWKPRGEDPIVVAERKYREWEARQEASAVGSGVRLRDTVESV